MDTQYNPVRPFPSQQYSEILSQYGHIYIYIYYHVIIGLLYLRRRNQLLQENVRRHDNPSVRRQYLQLRSQILSSRYGPLDKKYNINNYYNLSLHHII